jgi:Ca2+-transporting ATPase
MVTGTLLVFFLAGGGIDAESCEVAPLTDPDTISWMDSCLAGDTSEAQVYADEKFAYAQTMTFSVFILYQLFNVLNCRSSDESILKLGLFSNKAINLALIISFGLLLFFVQLSTYSIPLIDVQIGNLLSTMSLQATDWVVITLVASGVLIVDEFRKFIVKSRYFAVK